MKTVLMLAYHFPPAGGAGVQRSAKFARYLPEFGYRPAVVAGPGGKADRWTPSDRSLMDEIGADIRVLRVPGPEPGPSGRWQGRADRWLQRRTAWADWWIDGAVQQARAWGERADVVLASMSPFESAHAAGRIAVAMGVPWVADLRDPWALDEMTVYPTGFHRRLAEARMRKSLGSAAAIVMNTPEARRALEHRFPDLAAPVSVIPNGYDPADFDGAAPPEGGDRFRIVHAGYLHTDLGRQRRPVVRRALGGGTDGVDILTRSHVYLMQALDQIAATQPDMAESAELHLAGVLSDADREAIGRSVTVHEHGYLPHAEAVRLVRSADLLFLPMHDLPVGRRATIVPGKTYEYLASGRPILAAVPDGDARDLLARSPAAHLCRPGDSAGMAGIITAQIDRWRSCGRAPQVSTDPLAGYDRRSLAGSLASVLDATA